MPLRQKVKLEVKKDALNTVVTQKKISTNIGKTIKKPSIPFKKPLISTPKVIAKNFHRYDCIATLVNSGQFTHKTKEDGSDIIARIKEPQGELTIKPGKEENSTEWTCDITKTENLTTLCEAIKYSAEHQKPKPIFVVDSVYRYLIETLLKEDKTLEKDIFIQNEDGSIQSLADWNKVITSKLQLN